MESQLRHTTEAIAQKQKNMAAIQQEIELQVCAAQRVFHSRKRACLSVE